MAIKGAVESTFTKEYEGKNVEVAGFRLGAARRGRGSRIDGTARGISGGQVVLTDQLAYWPGPVNKEMAVIKLIKGASGREVALDWR